MNAIQKMKLQLTEKGQLTTGLKDCDIEAKWTAIYGNVHGHRPTDDAERHTTKRKRPPVKAAPKAPPAPTAPKAPLGALEQVVADIVAGIIDTTEQTIDEAQIKALIEKHATKTLEVKTKGETIKIEGAHKSLAELVQWLSVDEHVYMHGPAGSGKTTLASQAAEALGREFYKTGAVLSKYELVGFVDGAGTYHKTAFREAWEKGAVFLFDEMDSSAAEAIVAINDALSNGTYTFPDKPEAVPMGEGFRAIGAGNTTGTGATRQYVGRNPLDAASRDRFKVLEIEYDEALEERIGLAAFKQYGGKDENLPNCKTSLAELVRVRKQSDKLGFHVVVSPRATVRVAKAWAMWTGGPNAAQNEIYGNFTEDQKRQLKRGN